ncbi:hypothetical protein GOP47_0000663 [Adiantum capillus-veneris]|uniref:Uncharacterized protein n=1 Tax=Adiantum capillus-veneris TaxID=13818 RepID=A0A9D4VDQ9_ADICA|nr:hypothetical protein GOP47_0000663 [Adiantum capillus-veneris]
MAGDIPVEVKHTHLFVGGRFVDSISDERLNDINLVSLDLSEPSFDEAPWPILSLEARDFVKRLLTTDRHKRMTIAQALTHSWICGYQQVPLDIMIFRMVKREI